MLIRVDEAKKARDIPGYQSGGWRANRILRYQKYITILKVYRPYSTVPKIALFNTDANHVYNQQNDENLEKYSDNLINQNHLSKRQMVLIEALSAKLQLAALFRHSYSFSLMFCPADTQ